MLPKSGRSSNILAPQHDQPPRLRSEKTETAALVMGREHAWPHQAQEMQSTWRNGRNFRARDATYMKKQRHRAAKYYISCEERVSCFGVFFRGYSKHVEYLIM
jgi:hypothetical protein